MALKNIQAYGNIKCESLDCRLFAGIMNTEGFGATPRPHLCVLSKPVSLCGLYFLLSFVTNENASLVEGPGVISRLHISKAYLLPVQFSPFPRGSSGILHSPKFCLVTNNILTTPSFRTPNPELLVVVVVVDLFF